MADLEHAARSRPRAVHRLDPSIEQAIERWIVRSGACAHLEPADASALLRSIRREARAVLEQGLAAAPRSARSTSGHADAVVAASVARVIERERSTDGFARRA